MRFGLSDASYPRDLNLEPNSGVCLRGAVGRPQLSASLPRENALQFVQRVDRRGRIAGPRIARLLVGVLRHPRCGIQPHLMPGPLRHYEGDAPPVRGRSSGMSCPVGQDHITLALASFPIGLAAMVADQGLGVDLCQPAGFLATSEPLQHRTPFEFKVGVYGVLSAASALRAFPEPSNGLVVSTCFESIILVAPTLARDIVLINGRWRR